MTLFQVSHSPSYIAIYTSYIASALATMILPKNLLAGTKTGTGVSNKKHPPLRWLLLTAQGSDDDGTAAPSPDGLNPFGEAAVKSHCSTSQSHVSAAAVTLALGQGTMMAHFCRGHLPVPWAASTSDPGRLSS